MIAEREEVKQPKAAARRETSTQDKKTSTERAVHVYTQENEQFVTDSARASACADYFITDSLIGWLSSHHTKELEHK